MATFSATYNNNPEANPLGRPTVDGLYFQDQRYWVEGSAPASAADASHVVQNSAATAVVQKIWFDGQENSASGSQGDQTTLGHLTIRRGAGTNVVAFRFNSRDSRTLSGGSVLAVPQVINFSTTTGNPSLTLEAGTTLSLAKVNTTYDPLGTIYTLSYGARLKSTQPLDLFGPGTLLIEATTAGTMLTAGVNVHEGTIQGTESSIGAVAVLSAPARFRYYREGITPTLTYGVSTRVFSGAGTYELDLAPIIRNRSSGDEALPPVVVPTATTPTIPFTGTWEVTSAELHQQATVVLGGKVKIGHDGVFTRSITSGAGTTFVPQEIEGAGGQFNLIGLDYRCRVEFNNPFNFSGDAIITRSTLVLNPTTAANLNHATGTFGGYTGRYSGLASSTAWTGWPAGTAALRNVKAPPSLTYGRLNVGRSALVVVEGADDATVTLNRVLDFEAVSTLRSQISVDPTGAVNTSERSIRFAGTGTTTYDGRVKTITGVPVKYAVPQGKTVVHKYTGPGAGTALGYALSGPIQFVGDGVQVNNPGGTVVIDAPINAAWSLNNNMTLSFGPEGRAAGTTSGSVSYGTVEFSSPLAFGATTEEMRNNPVLGAYPAGYISAGMGFDSASTTGKPAVFRYTGTAEDCILDGARVFRLGSGITKWLSDGTKALKILSTQALYLDPAATSATLWLGGSSTAANTIGKLVTSDLSSKRITPAAAITIRPVNIVKVDEGTWVFTGDCEPTGDVFINQGKVQIASEDGSGKLSCTFAAGKTVRHSGGVLQTRTGTTQKGRHTYHNNLYLEGGILHLGG